MDEQPVGTLTFSGYTAHVYSTNTPGEFRVIYQDPAGKTLEEAPLTGISTYHQRESEILDRLRQFRDGARPSRTPDLCDAGEY
jgi:hypothetical protein